MRPRSEDRSSLRPSTCSGAATATWTPTSRSPTSRAPFRLPARQILMDPHPLVDAVENVRVGIRRSRRGVVRYLLGMLFAPLNAQPARSGRAVVYLVRV